MSESNTARAQALRGPVRSVRYIHNAILKETQEFEEAVRELDREDTAQVTALLDRFQFLRRVLTFHEESEELIYFQALASESKYLPVTYQFDHHRHAAGYSQIEETLVRLRDARTNGDRRELAERLGRHVIALNVFMELHIAKENELLYPTYDMLFSDEAQRAHERRMMAEHAPPPDLMGPMVVWIFRAQGVDDREGMLRSLMEMLPPPMLGGLTQMLAGQVSSQEWQEMVHRIPELGGDDA